MRFRDKLISDLTRSGLLLPCETPSRLKVLGRMPFLTARILMWIRIVVDGPIWMRPFFRRWLRFAHRIDIGKDVSIGPGLVIPHPWCIIIAAGIRLGENVNVGQYVTLGGNQKKRQDREGCTQLLPILGDRIFLGPGAVIGGPVTIGSDVLVGANSVVTKDVPSNSIVTGQNNIARKRIIVNLDGSFKVIEI